MGDNEPGQLFEARWKDRPGTPPFGAELNLVSRQTVSATVWNQVSLHFCVRANRHRPEPPIRRSAESSYMSAVAELSQPSAVCEGLQV